MFGSVYIRSYYKLVLHFIIQLISYWKLVFLLESKTSHKTIYILLYILTFRTWSVVHMPIGEGLLVLLLLRITRA